MALRPKWSPCPSVRFSPDGPSGEPDARLGRASARSALASLGCGAEEPRQRAAAAAADPGQRHDQREGDPCSRRRSAIGAGTDAADPAEPEPARSRRSRPTTPLDVVFVSRQPDPTPTPSSKIRGPKERELRPALRQQHRQLPDRPAHRLLHGQPPPACPAPSRPTSRSAPTAPPRRTTSCCPSRASRSRSQAAFQNGVWRLNAAVSIGSDDHRSRHRRRHAAWPCSLGDVPPSIVLVGPQPVAAPTSPPAIQRGGSQATAAGR